MSATSTLLNERLTFGVEIEFLIATLPRNEKDPHDNINGIPPALRYRPGLEGANLSAYTHRRVQAVLDELLGSLPLPSWIGGLTNTTVLDTFRNWIIDSDESLLPPSGDMPLADTNYTFVPIEIASPVQYASPRGFEIIELVISVIVSRFRCIVNPSCGVHVHIGLGSSRIPLEHIRRIASLSYAVEPLLDTLQNPTRGVNWNCRQLRYFSNLVHQDPILDSKVPHGDPNSSNQRHWCVPLGGERRHGEETLAVRGMNSDPSYVAALLATREAGHYEPFTTPGDSRHTTLLSSDIFDVIDSRISAVELPSSSTEPPSPARQRGIPRLGIQKYTRASLTRMSLLNERWGASLGGSDLDCRIAANPGFSMYEALERIYRQPSSCNIGHMLCGVGFPRIAISFHHYLCAYFEPPKTSPRTIEVRMGEGSLDGRWVATWAKILTGLFRFAIHSSPSQFIDLLANCERATKVDGAYDVVDLLDDVGLFAEAVIVEERLMAHKDEWDLRFVEPDA